MSINQLIFKSLKKNMTSYYLYVFALIFSVALYFAFVTLHYSPDMAQAQGSLRGAAGIKAASVLLIVIVTIFLLYANNLFIKRRSKEIGLYQLIGFTRYKVFRILNIENLLLYLCALTIGVFIGFSFSRLIIMILFSVTGVEGIVSLYFSWEALRQTLIVFGAIYLLIMLVNYLFIKRQTILSLFQVRSSTESRVKKLSFLNNLIGILGLALIILGYYLSTILFSHSKIASAGALFFTMITILASVILGTYLLYKGSVAFIANMVRKRKDGYLSIQQVLSLSSIMFRMKSNAMLLTIITTVSALTIGLLSLSYISFYSAEKMAESNIPAHFALTNLEDAQMFKSVLEENHIAYNEVTREVIQAELNIEQLFKNDRAGFNMQTDGRVKLPVISDQSIEGLQLAEHEILFSGYNDLMLKLIPLHDQGEIELYGDSTVIKQQYLGLAKEYYISYYFTAGGLPLAIVNESIFQSLKLDLNPEIQGMSNIYIGLDILDKGSLEQANALFNSLAFESISQSRLDLLSEQKQTMGLAMFIVAFLGLTFLITSGCILYFKQMDESDEEQPHYTILRKLGFSVGDILKGIKVKQCLNFGIPLIAGLLHSYFAVQSGWFLFGTEVWTPMLIVMILYTLLYSTFGVLSVLYSKRVIRSSL